MPNDITAALQECVKRMVPLVGTPKFQCFDGIKGHEGMKVQLIYIDVALGHWMIAADNSLVESRRGFLRIISDHSALCLWEHHLRVELEKRGAWVQPHDFPNIPERYLVYREYTHGNRFGLCGGKWERKGTFDCFDTHIDALMTGIEAVVTEEEDQK